MSIRRPRREPDGRFRHPSGATIPPETGTVAHAAQLTSDPTPEPTPQESPPARVPHTRTGAAWVALIGAALLAVLLIVFLVQNTHSTEISFLWMTTSTPLAVALLIAAVGSVLLTLILGTARIAQLRRLVRKQRT
jgi:uncharacterized integral membrane protein